MTKITLKIDGMHCTSCAFNIDGELEDTKGIKSASTNYAKQTTDVEFDEEEVAADAMINIIKKLGYTAAPVSKE